MATVAVIDGAGLPGLRNQLRDLGLEHGCLFAGKLPDALADVSPWLVQLESSAQCRDWLNSKCFVQPFGLVATLPAEDAWKLARRHFRSLQTVSGKDGRRLLFRYYDPRVLGPVLHSATREEREWLFGPLASLGVLTNRTDAIEWFEHHDGVLTNHRTPVQALATPANVDLGDDRAAA